MKHSAFKRRDAHSEMLHLLVVAPQEIEGLAKIAICVELEREVAEDGGAGERASTRIDGSVMLAHLPKTVGHAAGGPPQSALIAKREERIAKVESETVSPFHPFIHLDHGADLGVVVKCIRHGWTSVMIDASKLEYAANVAATGQVVEIAHMAGVPVEAELGRLGGIEDKVKVDEREAFLTDPDQASEFVERTGCDSLAIAIGTSHGAYKFKAEPKLDLDRLAEISRRVAIPLVLHGASSVPEDVLARAAKYGAKLPGAKGVPEEALKAAIARGIAKINIDTDLRLAFTGAVREILTEKPEVFDPRKILGQSRKAIKEVVRRKMELFGSSGKA